MKQKKVLSDSSTSVEKAFRVCRVFEATGMLSKPCLVSGWGRSVGVSIDTSSGEAREICRVVADKLAELDVRFDKDWKIKVYSPYSGDNSIAYCNLAE